MSNSNSNSNSTIDAVGLLRDAYPYTEGPFDLYQHFYDSSECGVTFGLRVVEGDGCTDKRWLYNDELADLADWTDMLADGVRVLEISTSSIVEGVPDEVPPITLSITADMSAQQLREAIGKAVDEVESCATAIWNATHGCPRCAYLNHGSPHDWHWPQIDSDLPDERWVAGNTAVHPQCPDCAGHGIAL